MRVFIDKEVHLQIESFYEAAMAHHITLDEATVNKKIDRLYDAMESLEHSHISITPSYFDTVIDAAADFSYQHVSLHSSGVQDLILYSP